MIPGADSTNFLVCHFRIWYAKPHLYMSCEIAWTAYLLETMRISP